MRARFLCGIFVAVAGTGWALGCGDDNSGEEPAGTGGAGGASGSDAGDAAGTGGTGALGGSDGAAGADGSAPTNLGAACTADSDCTSGLVCVKKGVSKFTQAIPGEFYPPHGMCSAECTTDAECSALVKGAVCKPGYNSTTVTKFCHEPCTRGEQSVWPSLSPEKCHGRADVACTSEGYCRPTCGSPADCESGDGCHYMYGLCRTGDLSEIDVDWGGPPKCKTSSTASVPDPSADAGQYYYCTGKCTHGSLTACGNAATATKAIAGCFLAEPGAPMGAGDRGGCARLCDCDADCAGPTVCLALFPAAVTQLGRYGYCWSATASDPGKPCASDAGTD